MTAKKEDQNSTVQNGVDQTPTFEEVKCEPFPQFKRNNYFPGKLLTATDFQMEQQYFINKHRLINRLVHGSGVLCGLKVVMNGQDGVTDLAPNHVRIQTGFALDVCGREIEVSKTQDLDIAAEVQGFDKSTTSFLILLCYDSCADGTQPSITDTSGCSEKCCVSTIRELYQINKSENKLPTKTVVINDTVKEAREAAILERAQLIEVKKVAKITIKQLLKEEEAAFNKEVVDSFASCPDCPDCLNNTCCIPLAKIDYVLDEKAGVVVKGVTDARPFVYNNPLLFKLIEQLARDEIEVALALDQKDTELANEINDLKKKQSYPKVQKISWTHDYLCESVEDWVARCQEGFGLTFSEQMVAETINSRNINLELEINVLELTSQKELQKVISVQEVPLLLKPSTKENITPNTSWLFKPDPNGYVFSQLGGSAYLINMLYKQFRPLDLRMILKLKGDFILGMNGNKCLDGNFLRGALPSGNGSEGGLFESWIRLSLTSENGLFGEYFAGANFEQFRNSRMEPSVDFEEEQLTRIGETEARGMVLEYSIKPESSSEISSRSIRWVGKISPKYSEEYTFVVATDGGVNLWIDNRPITKDWNLRASVTNVSSSAISLVAGRKYDITLECNVKSISTLMLKWKSKSQAEEVVPMVCLSVPQGLLAEYYSGATLSDLKVLRIDSNVEFDWKNGTPDPKVPTEGFSARWVGLISPKTTDDYTFYVSSDDGARLWINDIGADDKPLIDNWVAQEATAANEKHTNSIKLVAGQRYPIKLEFFESGGLSSITLSWATASEPDKKVAVPQNCLYLPRAFTEPRR